MAFDKALDITFWIATHTHYEGVADMAANYINESKDKELINVFTQQHLCSIKVLVTKIINSKNWKRQIKKRSQLKIDKLLSEVDRLRAIQNA